MKLGQRWFSKNKMAEGSSAQSLQFSGGEKEVIERKLDVSIDGLATRKDISDFYEISRCVNVIKNRGFEKVNSNFHNSTISSTGIIKTLLSSQIALQFPDSLLMDSAAVASLIEKNTGKKVFVLADTSYGRYISYPANLKYRR